jgi:hypothetical protein
MPILTPDDGLVAKTPAEAQVLQARGYQQCYGTSSKTKQACDYHIAPEAQEYVKDKGGYYTCPRCMQSHDLMYDLPWHGSQNEDDFRDTFSAGGGTRIGLGLKDQSQIGEDLVEELGKREGGLPGYGPIVWVHPGGSISQSPLDMATAEWGIEVKTLGYDAIHHRFIPGRPKEKNDKNQMAVAKGLKGVLGILVILNYRNSLADIYVREYPVDLSTGAGVGSFRSQNGTHLIAEVPFKNPFMQPDHPAPTEAEDEIPF